MFHRPLIAAVTLATVLFASAPALAAPLSITFESFPGADGVLGTADDVPASTDEMSGLSNQYAALGLTFQVGTLFRDGFFDGNPNNHYLSSSDPIGILSVPVFGISIDSWSYWNATISAFDANGQLIASSTLVHPDEGASLFRGNISLSTTEQIYSFSVTPNDPDWILNLDNLVLDVGATHKEIPEPSQWLLFPAALGLMALRRRSKR